MPGRLYLPADVRERLQNLPPEIRRAAAGLLLLLLSEPVPEQAVPDPDVKNGYRIDAPLVTIFYGVYPDEIRVFLIRPNT